MVFQIEKKSQILKFGRSWNFYYCQTQKKNQSSEIVQFQKLANFFNLTIYKTIKIQKFRI